MSKNSQGRVLYIDDKQLLFNKKYRTLAFYML